MEDARSLLAKPAFRRIGHYDQQWAMDHQMGPNVPSLVERLRSAMARGWARWLGFERALQATVTSPFPPVTEELVRDEGREP